MKIYVSGLYSGTNPQPGVGIARSLRAAYPEAEIIGVEYSNRCSGIHWPDLDNIWLQRPWPELDLDSYGEQINQILDDGAFWISSVDLEIMWLASRFPEGHPNLLTPTSAALKKTIKPAVEAHAGLPVRIPEFITTEASDWDLHAFCREYGWKVWLKGPYYEAVRTGSWDAFERMRSILSTAWSTDRLFLQRHVTGYEESVCFCAYRGELISAVYMRKRELTEEGKTWSGEITDVPISFLAPLRKVVAELQWTGGAELEMVRDAQGGLWLLECNPRFPAWIHGATITGRNLPAQLVQSASGVGANHVSDYGEEFTRVVLEIPVRREFPLPSLPEPFPGGVGHSLKHPSGTLALAERLQKLHIIEGKANDSNGDALDESISSEPHTEPTVPSSFIDDLDTFDFQNIETPSWLFFPGTAETMFKQASQMAAEVSNNSLHVKNGYSIKTNPDERLLKLALENGFHAEAISLLEVQKALRVGFRPDQIILNGPGKWWPSVALPSSPIHAVFSDSLADLQQVIEKLNTGELQTHIAGVRLRTPTAYSRFGIPVSTPEFLGKLADAVMRLPLNITFGVHFHMASSNIGIHQWWHLYESMLRWCRSLETLTGRRIESLDVGGGWFPDDWPGHTGDRLGGAIERAQQFLPYLREIISEPGKALAQPSTALAVRLLEFDDTTDELTEAVVDGSIAELPMHFFQPHRILHRDPNNGRWQQLKRGKTHLLGRLCMEHDVVAANVSLPSTVKKGDVLVFCDTGGYDRSMSYEFGRG